MSYRTFAKLYDDLMSEAPYEQWVQYVTTRTSEPNNRKQTLLDVGCGTGKLLLHLHEKGFVCTGVDRSEEMLTIAQETLPDSIPLFAQDMKELQIGNSFNIITIFCDSLNYVTVEEDIRSTFRRVYEHLNEGGLFLFDVHSPQKILTEFIGQTFAHSHEDVSYIWESFKGEESLSVEHELTFFIKRESGLYERVEELHVQRTFPIETYEEWLVEAGFQSVKVTADFTANAPNEESERIFFEAKK